MLSFHEYMRLGPEATKKQDKEELGRQKDHLMVMSKQSQERAEKEGDNGMAGAFHAKAAAYARLSQNIREDGMVGVAGIAGSGDSRLPATQREPGVSKKKTPVMGNIRRRNLPQM
jgi:ABC-type uncharacterized transport system ATPase subunit